MSATDVSVADRATSLRDVHSYFRPRPVCEYCLVDRAVHGPRSYDIAWLLAPPFEPLPVCRRHAEKFPPRHGERYVEVAT